MSLQRVDLNLFRVFEAVFQHRSVSGASKELGVSPSAVSHALARLRQAVGDELFVYGEAGMQPTARALELAPGVRDGLDRLEDAIHSKTFNPLASTRTFRIAASDYTTITILTGLVQRLASVAPQVDLRIFPPNRMDVVKYLDDGRLDVVVGWFSDLPDRMSRATIMTDREALVVRKGHPLTKGAITKARLFAYPYAIVELTGSEDQALDGFVDDRGVLRRVWVDRLLIETNADDEDEVGHVAITLPSYAAIPSLVASTDMVATLPELLARRAAADGSVVVLDLPYEPLTVPVEAIWHYRADRDSGLQWLLGELLGIERAPNITTEETPGREPGSGS